MLLILGQAEIVLYLLVVDAKHRARAGDVLTAVSESFEVTADNGIITLDFSPTKGDALVSSVEIVPLK